MFAILFSSTKYMRLTKKRKRGTLVAMKTEKKTGKREIKVWEIIKGIGYNPQEHKNIVVSYALKNLSAKVAGFFTNQFYVLSICENELVLIPYGEMTWSLKKEVALEVPFDSIKSVTVKEDGFNYMINIETSEDNIELTTQQKELSNVRMSGALSYNSIWGASWNWHQENLDETLESLQHLGE